MPQSELTVTVVSPTPPTNLLCAFGGTPPTTDGLAFTDDGVAAALNTVMDPSSGTVPEAKGTIVTVVAPGSRAECPTQSISVLGNYTSTPNADHASGKAPSVLPTITALAPAAPVSGAGKAGVLTVTGTGFQMDSVVYLAGVAQPTSYLSPTQLRVQNAAYKAAAGNIAVTVVTGGTATAATNWVFS